MRPAFKIWCKHIFTGLFIPLVLVFAGCKKSNIDSTELECYNGGIFDQNTYSCMCPMGYQGINCEVDYKQNWDGEFAMYRGDSSCFLWEYDTSFQMIGFTTRNDRQTPTARDSVFLIFHNSQKCIPHAPMNTIWNEFCLPGLMITGDSCIFPDVDLCDDFNINSGFATLKEEIINHEKYWLLHIEYSYIENQGELGSCVGDFVRKQNDEN